MSSSFTDANAMQGANGSAVSAVGAYFRTPDPAAMASLGGIATFAKTAARLKWEAATALSAIHTAAARRQTCNCAAARD